MKKIFSTGFVTCITILIGMQTTCPARANTFIPKAINRSASLLSLGSTLNALEYFGDIRFDSNFAFQGSYDATGFTNTVTGQASGKALNFTVHGTTAEYDAGNRYATTIAGNGSLGSQKITTSAQLELVYDPSSDYYSGTFLEDGSKNPLWLVLAVLFLSTGTLYGVGEIEDKTFSPPPKPPRKNIPININSSKSYFGQVSFSDIYESNGSILGGADVTPTPVPAPLPLFGAGAAFAWSRTIRRKLKSKTSR